MRASFSLLSNTVAISGLIRFNGRRNVGTVNVDSRNGVFNTIGFFRAYRGTNVGPILNVRTCLARSTSVGGTRHGCCRTLLVIRGRVKCGGLYGLVSFTCRGKFCFGPHVSCTVLTRRDRKLIVASTYLNKRVPRLLVGGGSTRTRHVVS